MLKINDKTINTDCFPDGTMLIKENVSDIKEAVITWKYENDSETLALIYLTRHLKSHGTKKIHLNMPYIPNARQDRVKTDEDVFTLKYFSEIINNLEFTSVTVLDPHSYVSEALIDRIIIKTPQKYISRVIDKIGSNNLIMFYPDEGAMKRYSAISKLPYAFGIKKRDWETGSIKGLELSGNTELIKGSDILIVDDICSRGGTFYHSSKKLKEYGANNIYLYISHCENTILQGELLTCGFIEKVFTTDSIFTKKHEKIEVLYNE